MTREEILAMQPGPEMNRVVAIHVMGWQMYHYDKDVEENCYCMLVDEDFEPVAEWESYNIRQGERKTEEEAWNDCPDFSGMISTAWEVLNKFESGQVSKIPMTGRFRAIIRANKNVAYANNAPEAICKAALLATLGTK